MSNRISIAGLCLGVSVLLSASAANAAVTTYPASLCAQNTKVWNQTALYFMGPEVATLTGATDISCPVDQHGGNILSASVSGKAWSAVVSCALEVRDKFNDSGFSTASLNSTPVPTTPEYTINFRPFPHFFVNGTKNVICHLPSGSPDFAGTVASYTIEEA